MTPTTYITINKPDPYGFYVYFRVSRCVYCGLPAQTFRGHFHMPYTEINVARGWCEECRSSVATNAGEERKMEMKTIKVKVNRVAGFIGPHRDQGYITTFSAQDGSGRVKTRTYARGLGDQMNPDFLKIIDACPRCLEPECERLIASQGGDPRWGSECNAV